MRAVTSSSGRKATPASILHRATVRGIAPRGADAVSWEILLVLLVVAVLAGYALKRLPKALQQLKKELRG